MRKSMASLVVLAFFGIASGSDAFAQHHHHHHGQYQKGGPAGAPESGMPPATPESAGYAASPPSGTREGATGGVGINGPSIELPALSLKLPTIRIPGLTRFTTPPHMRVKESLAPLVGAPRQEYTFDSGTTPTEESGRPPRTGPLGEPESGVPESGAPGQKEFQKNFQKAAYDDCPECQRELQQLAKAEADRALEKRLSALESSIGRLVNGLEAAQASNTRQRENDAYPQPFPAVTVQDDFPVSRSNYEHVQRLPPRLLPTQLHRLPRVR